MVSCVTFIRVWGFDEKTSSANIQFDRYDNKQEFERWLGTYGGEVKSERSSCLATTLTGNTGKRKSGDESDAGTDAGQGWRMGDCIWRG